MTRQASRPLFLTTHPRSASTAFERSFMSREDTEAIHEPFGEPFYLGPERLSGRYKKEECEASEYKTSTYAQVLNWIQQQQQSTGKNVFIKDMAQYVIPPQGTGEMAKSFQTGTHNNPTVLPDEALHSFNYVFLIRAPHLAVPSYYVCCIPPKSERTGFHDYRSCEAGYRELRLLFEHLVKNDPTNAKPLVVDSDDLTKDPEQVMRKVCEHGDIPFDKSMLTWSDKDQGVIDKFAKWPGFHDDALKSTGFRVNPNATKEDTFKVDWEAWENGWKAKFDDKGVEIIRDSVKEHLDDYLYLRQFKLKLE